MWKTKTIKSLRFLFVTFSSHNLLLVFFIIRPVVQIFVEHRGDNLQFYPILPYFDFGGMNLDHDFFSGEQIK